MFEVRCARFLRSLSALPVLAVLTAIPARAQAPRASPHDSGYRDRDHIDADPDLASLR